MKDDGAVQAWLVWRGVLLSWGPPSLPLPRLPLPLLDMAFMITPALALTGASVLCLGPTSWQKVGLGKVEARVESTGKSRGLEPGQQA